MKKLTCEQGKHEWETPSSRGKYPKDCPEHKLNLEAKEKSPKSISGIIKKVLKERGDSNCKCEITPEINRVQLRKLGAGCTASKYLGDKGWVCPTLDAVRRAIGYE